MTTSSGQGFMLLPDDDDWQPWDDADPDDPCWYLPEDDGIECLTAAERNPSLLTK